ncbi:MAG: TolC family protein [Candidatus Omnitrophica bacterium]|nr:TolC family protein [Candidatus Omnitrophota bacterium]
MEILIRYAKRENPEILSAKAEWLAATKRIWIDSSLPDPMVRIAPGDMEKEFEVSQEIPFPVKLAGRRKMARQEAERARFRYLAVERDVVNRLNKAYYDLYFTDASIAVIEEIKALLKRFESVAQARYSNLTGAQRDVAKAQAEVSMSLERLYGLKQQRESTAALINALLNRDPMEPMAKAVLPGKPVLKLTLVELVNLAVQNRQEIQAAEAAVAKSGVAKRLAKLAYLPDVNVGFEYTRSDKEGNSWMIPIRFNVPLWQNRIIPEIQEAKQLEEARKADLLRAKNETFFEVKDSFYRFDSAAKIADLYELAVIPQAQLALKSDQAGYEASKTDFLNLLDSERIYFNAKLSHVQFTTEALKAHADLVRATGLDFEKPLPEESEKSNG